MAEVDYNVIAQEVLSILKSSGKDLPSLPQASSPAGLQLAPVLKTEGGTTTAFRIDIALLKGDKGDTFTYSDFTPAQLESLKVKGDKGDDFKYSDFTPAQLDALKVKGDAFKYSDFTPAQLESLKVKGDKGDDFKYSDFTPAQLDALKVKGDAFIMAKKNATIQIKRGQKINLPVSGLLEGELILTTDTKELYIGNASGGAASIKTFKAVKVTLSVANWVQAGELWTYIVNDTDFKEDSFIEVIPPLPTSEDFEVFQDAEFYSAAKASVGNITLYAKNKPTAAIIITYIIF